MGFDSISFSSLLSFVLRTSRGFTLAKSKTRTLKMIETDPSGLMLMK